MRKTAIFLIVIMLFCGINVYAENSVKVTYNGDALTCDVEPYIENSRTLIPVRMAEQLGYKVEWKGETREVTLEKKGKSILLKIDSNIAEVDGDEVEMDVPAKIKENRTFVPVRFVSENFGYFVDWDGETRTVVIEDIEEAEKIDINDVQTEKNREEFLIKLFSSETIKAEEPFKLLEPLRYVYDIKGGVLNIPKVEVPVNSDIIDSVVCAQFEVNPNTVRIVIKLKRETQITAGYKNGIYTISVSDGGVPTVNSLKLIEGDNTASVFLSTDMTVNYTTYKLSNPTRYVVELPDSDIAVNDVVGSGEVVKKATLTRKDGKTALTVYLDGIASATKCYITRDGGNIVVTVNKDKKTPALDTNKEDFLIVIDPGHGGDEPGSLGMIDGKIALYEKDINLKIGKRVYEILLERGYNVIATRTDDTTVSLQKRVEIANESDADLFVSVHNNSFENDTAYGTLTMYAYDEPKEGQEFSGKEVAAIIQPYLVEATEGFDRELMENPKIYVNAKTNMPAVLCECLFMSNPDDLKKLMDDTYAEKIALGIADGVCEAVSLMNK